jgi:serine/threonine protein kinase
VPDGQNPLQDLLLAGPQPNCNECAMQVEDEVKFPEYIDVSEEAKSFILGILQKDPDDRMVMKDIFKHPFIKKYLT